MAPSTAHCVFIDNISNNNTCAVQELSDLYACEMPVQMRVIGKACNKIKVTFASFEHAWNVLRFLQFPPPGRVHNITTVQNMTQRFEVTLDNACLFMRQFERDGVFASWEKFDTYYNIHQIPFDNKSQRNIGLVARYVAGTGECSERIRQIVRAVAADRFGRNQSDMVSECIAACLWKCEPDFSCYTKLMRQLCKVKLKNNIHIRNVMYNTGDTRIVSNLDKCRMVTETRRVKTDIYVGILRQQRSLLTWTLCDQTTLAFLMAFHARLGRESAVHSIGNDILFIILQSMLCVKRRKSMLTCMKRS